jgi:hypothetical protein
MIFRGYGTAKMAKKRQAWEKTRQKGKSAYLFRRGMLRWGGSMFLFSTFMDILARRHRLDWPLLATGLVVWPLAGYAWAQAMWMMHERFLFGWPKKQPATSEDQPLQAELSTERGVKNGTEY